MEETNNWNEMADEISGGMLGRGGSPPPDELDLNDAPRAIVGGHAPSIRHTKEAQLHAAFDVICLANYMERGMEADAAAHLAELASSAGTISAVSLINRQFRQLLVLRQVSEALAAAEGMCDELQTAIPALLALRARRTGELTATFARELLDHIEEQASPESHLPPPKIELLMARDRLEALRRRFALLKVALGDGEEPPEGQEKSNPLEAVPVPDDVIRVAERPTAAAIKQYMRLQPKIAAYVGEVEKHFGDLLAEASRLVREIRHYVHFETLTKSLATIVERSPRLSR